MSDNRESGDRLAIFELLAYIVSSFLSAWLLAGFSLWTLWELVASVLIAGQFVFATMAGGFIILVITRLINQYDGSRNARRPPDTA